MMSKKTPNPQPASQKPSPPPAPPSMEKSQARDMTSDEIVQNLQPYGVVYVFQNRDDKTFSARAELFMYGMKSEVTSGFRHPTMLSALTALQDNVFAVVEK